MTVAGGVAVAGDIAVADGVIAVVAEDVGNSIMFSPHADSANPADTMPVSFRKSRRERFLLIIPYSFAIILPNELRLDVAAKKQDLGQFNCAATSSRVELSRLRTILCCLEFKVSCRERYRLFAATDN
jgi:hypothetical protein